MPSTVWDPRFLATSRGRIVTLLRREGETAEGLARAIGLSGNAVRGHLAVLERDGMVRVEGTRGGVGKPAQVYKLTSAAEARLSKAYEPLLKGLLDELESRFDANELEALLRATGRRLAPRRAATPLPLAQGAAAIGEILTELGGAVESVISNGTATVRGAACPLADVTGSHPAVCRGLEALLREVTGLPVSEECDRSGRPKCRFVVGRES